MHIVESDITIIGAGLTGLTIAYLLRDKDIKITILEARERLGGRIYTQTNNNDTPLDLGATWFSNQHTEVLELLKQLKLKTFNQHYSATAIYEPQPNSKHQIVALPQNNEGSYRLVGGTSHLINTLYQHIKPTEVKHNEIVTSITQENAFVSIKTNTSIYKSGLVISTLPPNLFDSTITVHPELPKEAKYIMQNTHTWMGDSIKVGLKYSAPFWRENNLSGTIFSNAGPITEFYDHCNYQNNQYALKGFLKSDYFSITKEERLTLITNQLKKYYGDGVKNYTAYEELVWTKEHFTYANYNNSVFPHTNNGHTIYKTPFLDKKLYIAGTETSASYSGKMEGAIRSAQYICKQVEELK